MLVSSWIRCDGMMRCIRRAIARARNGLCQPPPIVALKRTIVAYEVCKVFEYKHNLQVFLSIGAAGLFRCKAQLLQVDIAGARVPRVTTKETKYLKPIRKVREESGCVYGYLNERCCNVERDAAAGRGTSLQA